MTKADLERIRDLIVERLATGSEPPWVWYQLMKLREASEALMDGMEARLPTGGLQAPGFSRGASLQVVGTADQQESAQRHQCAVPARLPT
jgi:hypothetical protein